MKKTVLTFGPISGVVAFAVFLAGATLAMSDGEYATVNPALGFLIMLVALSVIFVGIKRYRDRELGGVIRFGKALLVGTCISLVAGLVYMVCWELYMMATDYTFAGEYAQAMIESQKAQGVTGEELEAFVTSMETLVERSASPLFRLPMAFLELFPFGFFMSLISAALLRNSRFLPAKA